MDQQTYLRVGKRELGLSWAALAAEFGVSPRTVEKWVAPNGTRDHREMPLMARKFLMRLLEERKRDCLLAGDRATAEVIDAVSAQVNPEKLRQSLLAFDALQNSAHRLAALSSRQGCPGYFMTPAEKNAWNEQDELRNARRAAETGARTR